MKTWPIFNIEHTDCLYSATQKYSNSQTGALLYGKRLGLLNELNYKFTPRVAKVYNACKSATQNPWDKMIN